MAYDATDESGPDERGGSEIRLMGETSIRDEAEIERKTQAQTPSPPLLELCRLMWSNFDNVMGCRQVVWWVSLVDKAGK